MPSKHSLGAPRAPHVVSGAVAALLLSALLASAGCGGDAAHGGRPWGGVEGPRSGLQTTNPPWFGAGNPGGVIEVGGEYPTPLVVSPEDARGLEFPVRVIAGDGAVREVATADELAALLSDARGASQARPEVDFVRLFYATDRRREVPGPWAIASPLWPAAIALIGALLVTRLLLRWLRVEHRRVAYAAGALLLVAAGGLVFRGATLALETLRLARETDVLYGSARSASGRLEFGTVLVSIPAQRHQVARIEQPSILRGELYPDPTRHFVIDDVSTLPREPFFEALHAAIAASPEREACVFVHGYNNTFAYAAMRLAQIVYDLGFEGAPILYSWPSQGAAALYTYDKENADWSAGNLAGFLADLRARSGADRVHLLAHSMGSRVLSTALMQSDAPAAGEPPFYSELVLAAPDLDADTFARFIAPQLMRRARRVTLYASERDEALLASVQVNGQRRAGMAGEHLVVIDGMDTVDVTQVAGGHAYISESGRVLVDLVDIVRHHRAAVERSALAPRELGGARYWEMVRQ